MPSIGGLIAGIGIFIAIIVFVGYFLYKRLTEVKNTEKVTLHCDTCNVDETYTNMLDSEFKQVYVCPKCNNPRRIVK